MKKEIILLIIGLVAVTVGALFKIQGAEWGRYVMMAGLAVEAYVLGALVLKSLRKK